MAKLTLSAHPEKKSIRAGEAGSLRVALLVRAAGGGVERARPDVTCALALDVSGSMTGPPLEMLVASVEKLCELAQPRDRLAMVAFSDSATLVAPLTEMDAAGKRLFAARARRLYAEGGTNVEDGIRKAGEVVAAATGAIRTSILLLSDGQPNRGAASPSDLAAVARELRPRVTTSTLGYGVQHSDHVLSAIAEAGAGRFSFIPDPSSCRRELAMALGAQSDIVVGEVELVLAPAEGVEIRRVVGDPPLRFGRDGVRLPLSDMEDGSERVIVLELALPRALPFGKVLDARAAYRDAETTSAGSVDTVVTVDQGSTDGPLDPDAVALVLLARAEEARRAARALADRGQFAGAAASLRVLLDEIAAAPGYRAADGSPLSEAYEQLLDEATAFERNPSSEGYSVFRKQALSQRLDADGTKSVAPRRGATSRFFLRATSGTPKEAHLVVVAGPGQGKAFRVGETCAIGRTSGADVVLPSGNVSRRHAEIYVLESDHWVCDLGSTNTTLVNGQRLGTVPHKLAPGDVIRVGDVELRYELGPVPV
jgi:Ca-activated chloride channel family protein